MMPLPATLFLGYALLGGALFLFSSGLRSFIRESDAPADVDAAERWRRTAVLIQAVVLLVLATLLLLGGTIAIYTVVPQLLA